MSRPVSVLARALVVTSCLVATTTVVHLARAEQDEAAGARPAAPAPRDDEAAARTAFPEADLGLAVLGVAYEHVVARPVSLRLAGGYTRAWYTSGDPRGGYLEARPFFFLAGPGAPAGLYVSPFGRVGFISASRDDVSGKSTGWTAGVTAGYGWLLGRVLVRVGAGAQLWCFDVDTSAGRAGLRGVLPDIDAIVGYGFLFRRPAQGVCRRCNEFQASGRPALSSPRDTAWGGTRFAA